MEELNKLKGLLSLERDEDLNQYRKSMLETPLGERKKKGLTWYPVEVKDIGIGLGEKLFVSIERTTHLGENHNFQVGGMVSLFNNSNNKEKGDNLPGVIASVWRNAMRIYLNVDEVPDWIEYGTIGVDVLFDSATYKEMDYALQKVISAKEGRLFELRNILLGKEPAEFHEIENEATNPLLNESQNRAVNKILKAQDVAIIHGPPGTGKTTTIVAAIQEVLKIENQVLVTAPSNTAVDLLTEKLAEKGVNVLRIGNPARVNEDLMQYSLEARITNHDDYRFLKKLRKNAEELRKMGFKYKRKFGKAEREQRKLLFAESRKMLDEATYLEKFIVDSLVNEAQVITATLVGTVNKFIRHKTFSTVFIDEAGQALEPACWIPIIKSERVVFAGDHQQLPPTVKSFEAEKEGLGITLFEKCIKRQKVDVMLQTQYRMNEQIMEFSSQQFYSGGLLADKTVKNHLLVENKEDYLLSQPVEFIDTAGCGFDEEAKEESQSKFNSEEANLMLKHLRNLLLHINSTYQEIMDETFSVGLISPYKAQVQYIREKFNEDIDLKVFSDFVDINSIDGFQGQERDIIYISLVRSNEKNVIGFLNDIRRLNVALTRARKKLVVIGDSSTLSNHNFYNSFLAYIDKIDAYKSAWEWISD
ncbi:AAA domain-containing protein [Flexithrix dorotheae]|uniref:AAA domain-containing protein n=1 Tax=Flexithrix dorotheae TaxID=70993 RepID=UPI000363FCB3|nr:AAA domain-containing protein [Flexithrix dorotheae]